MSYFFLFINFFIEKLLQKKIYYSHNYDKKEKESTILGK